MHLQAVLMDVAAFCAGIMSQRGLSKRATEDIKSSISSECPDSKLQKQLRCNMSVLLTSSYLSKLWHVVAYVPHNQAAAGPG
jgi:hypothetical protein